MGKSHFKMVSSHHGQNLPHHNQAAARHIEELSKRQSPSIPDECTKGGFITSPAFGSSIDALAPVPVAWLPACLPNPTDKAKPVDKVDIYLYAPGLEYPRIQKFSNIPNNGTVSLGFKPRWWEAKQNRELQLQILPQGVESFLSELPAGPLFQAKWEEVQLAAGAPVPDALDTSKIEVGETVVGATSEPASLKSGKTAVAVLIPLLVLALGGFAFFKWKRRRGLEKRKDWAEQVDKRMSTISTDWKSVTVAGAQAGIRHSMAASRASMALGNNAGGRGSFSFGNIRPQSGFGGDLDEKAGVLGQEESGGFDKAQRRPGVGLRNPSGLNPDRSASSVYTTRTSRVSFADQARPSMESSRRTKTFRDSYIPPVPVLPTRRPSTDSQTSDDITSGNNGHMSPTQSVGAITLTPEDIRARIAAGRARADSRGTAASSKKSVTHNDRGMSEVDGDVLPALAMMRANAEGDDYLLAQPTPPAATYPKPLTAVSVHTSGDGALGAPARAMTMSPVMSTLPMPASVMSPDEMLRAYAERKKSGIVYPQPPAQTVVAPGGRMVFGGMVSPTHTGETAVPKVPQLGFGVGEYDSNFSFGQQNTGETASTKSTLETPSTPLSKRKSASNNPYFAHAQQAYAAPQTPDDAYAYDAGYAAGPYVVGEVETEEGEVVPNRAGRGAYRG